MKKHEEGRRGVLHKLATVILILSIFYLVYCFTLFLLQRQIIFPRHLIGIPDGMGKRPPDIEQIWLETPSGKVESWFLPPSSRSDARPSPAMIFAHGNAELIDFWPEELRAFTMHGIGILLVEYPGYGRSQGSPSQKSITGAFIAAYDYLAAREDIDPARIILFGRSLGGGAVCSLAARRNAAALILMSSFTTARSFAMRFLAPGFLARDPFDNLQIVSSFQGPVLIIHGRNDSIVPYRQGISLYRAAKKGHLVTYDCDHNDCPPDRVIFVKDVVLFLLYAGIIRNQDGQRDS